MCKHSDAVDFDLILALFLVCWDHAFFFFKQILTLNQ